MHAEAYSAAEVMHGPLALVGPASRYWRWPRGTLPNVGRRVGRPAGRQGGDSIRRPDAGEAATMLPLAATGHPLTDPLTLMSPSILSSRHSPGTAASTRPTAQSAQGDGDNMSAAMALTGERIFDGESWHEDAALVVRRRRGRNRSGAADAGRTDDRRSSTAICSRPASSTCRSMAAAACMLNDHPTRTASARSAGRMRRSARQRCWRR